MSQKVFGIGFHKTGTKTLGSALQTLGYSVVDGGGKNLLPYLVENRMEPIWDIIEKYDAFKDNPWPLLYKELDKKYPGSKFILTVREEEKWIKSVTNYFGENSTDMRKWIYGIGYPKGHEDIYAGRYRQHNEEVREYFQSRPMDLIELCWERGDNWEKLCEFLGKTVPTQEFPHANKGRYSDRKNSISRIKSVFKNKFSKV